MIKSSVFGGSIAMSWMWGLGLFFSVHFTFHYGWIGLLCFAIPNALGLATFGWIVGRRARANDLAKLAESVFAAHPLAFAIYQVAAVALTLFAFIAYFLAPLGVSFATFAGLAFLAIGILIGEVFKIRRLITLQFACMLVALAAMALLLQAAPRAPHSPISGPDLSLFGLAIPLITGLLVGPFFDMQQWQRAVALQKEGLSVPHGFYWGAAIFFVMLLMSGAVTNMVTGGLDQLTFIGSDGQLHAEAAVTVALSNAGGIVLLLYGTWVVLCVITTFDSAQAALSWFVPSVSKASNNALLAMVPAGLLTSTLPLLSLSAAIAVGALYVGIHLEYFMILYASIFAAYGANLALDLYRDTALGGASTIILFSGIASMLLIGVGYLEDVHLLMVMGSVIALLSLRAGTKVGEDNALATDSKQPPGRHTLPARGGAETGVDTATDANGHLAPAIETLPLHHVTSGMPVQAGDTPIRVAPDSGMFDGKWFEVKLTATYSDTNSVGNIYFANYVSWVGKTRELFFRRCMPSFELKETPFYILTRSFNHKFIQEAKEFDEVVVRLRIWDFNRKFVRLEHKLFDGQDGLLGRGEQSLMFVTSDDYRLIDIPPDVVTAFTPYV